MRSLRRFIFLNTVRVVDFGRFAIKSVAILSKPLRTDDRSGLSLALTLYGRYDRRDEIRVHISLRRKHVRFKVNRPFRSCSPANDCTPSFTARSDKPPESFSSSRKSCHVSDVCSYGVGIYLSFVVENTRRFHINPSPPPIHLRFECTSSCGYPSLKPDVSLLLLLASRSFPLGEFIYLVSPRPLFPTDINLTSAKYLPFSSSPRFLHLTEPKSSTIDFFTSLNSYINSVFSLFSPRIPM